MSSQQGLRQASARAIHGQAGDRPYNADMRLMFEAEATIPATATFNEAFIIWLQTRLGSSEQNLPGLMQAFAEANGATNWASLGSFNPATDLGVLLGFNPTHLYDFTDGSGGALTDSSGNSNDGTLGTTTAAPTWVASPASLSFDGGDFVSLPAASPLGIDLVFNSDNQIISGALGRTVLAQASNDESAISFGESAGGIANEIIRVSQSDVGNDPGYTGTASSEWRHASENIAAGGWHLLQTDFNLPAAGQYSIVIDGVERVTNAATMIAWINAAWALGHGIAGVSSGSNGFQGDVAYLVFYPTAGTTQDQATRRTAISNIMADRSITLP